MRQANRLLPPGEDALERDGQCDLEVATRCRTAPAAALAPEGPVEQAAAEIESEPEVAEQVTDIDSAEEVLGGEVHVRLPVLARGSCQ